MYMSGKGIMQAVLYRGGGTDAVLLRGGGNAGCTLEGRGVLMLYSRGEWVMQAVLLRGGNTAVCIRSYIIVVVVINKNIFLNYVAFGGSIFKSA